MSTAGRGNNTRCRCWCFTINNPTVNQGILRSHIEAPPHFRYGVFQLEKSASGTPHFQGYLEFKMSMRFNTIKNLIGGNPHIEPRKGTRDRCRDYCMKHCEGCFKDTTHTVDVRLAGPWEFGNYAAGGAGTRNDIAEIADQFKAGKRIHDIANEYPSVYVRYHKGLEKLYALMQSKRTAIPSVTLIYGKTGLGKTHMIMEGMDDVFKKDGCDQWFDGYASEKILLIDDFAGKKSRIALSFMLNLLDRYQVRLPVKGSFVELQAKHVFVTTNIHPRMWYDYEDREEHYNALRRRFTEVIYFPGGGWDNEISITKKSFWDDWAQGCNEGQCFKKIPPPHDDEEDSSDSEVMFELAIDATQPTQSQSQHYCVECGLLNGGNPISNCTCFDD